MGKAHDLSWCVKIDVPNPGMRSYELPPPENTIFICNIFRVYGLGILAPLDFKTKPSWLNTNYKGKWFQFLVFVNS